MAEQLPPDDALVEQEGLESEAPRRGASAQFVVDGRTGDAAALREAMNPANQSLAEALRLTFRVLQVVIVVLIVMFLFSGFKTIDEGNTGVKTLFGAIHGEPNEEALPPGPVLFWPYPIGETLTFPVKRGVDLGMEYWPQIKNPNRRIDQEVDASSTGDAMIPGRDGSLLTREGDLFHMKVTAEYIVRDARRMVQAVRPEEADQLVTAALKRGVVSTAAELTLATLADIPQEPMEMIRQKAQATLDSLDCGLEITQITIPERSAPLPIRKAYDEVQQARQDGRALVEKARQDAEKTLNQAAGPKYREYITMITEYEALSELGEKAAADEMLEKIGQTFEMADAAGEVAHIINSAISYRTNIQSTLGADAERFLSLLPAYRRNPGLLISNLWYDKYQQVMSAPDAEILTVAYTIGGIKITVPTSRDVWELRRKADLDFRKAQADYSVTEHHTLQEDDITIQGAGRQLSKDRFDSEPKK